MMTLKTLNTRIQSYKQYIERNEHMAKNSKVRFIHTVQQSILPLAQVLIF